MSDERNVFQSFYRTKNYLKLWGNATAKIQQK